MTTDSNSPITAPPPAPPLVPEVARTPVRRAGPSRWTAFGNGVGIEIRDKDLQVTIVRVRPSETGVLGAATVTDYRTRPAAEWGTELLGFFRKVGAGHIAATVLLPRRDVIVRTLHLPGVQDNDLESAVSLQMDSLHPFTDEDVCFSWARLGKTPYVLIGLARRQVVDTYSSLFAEAGLKIVSFTFSAAAIYSALRIITTPPPGFVIAHKLDNGFELYGESEARPVYSATLPTTRERALEIASSELRLDPRTEPAGLHDLLPKPSLYPADYDPQSPVFGTNALTYAAALAGACPWLGIEGNVLPAELRRGSSRVRLIPTITLAVILAALLIVLGVESSWFDSRYLAVLQHQIALSEPAAKRVDVIDRAVAATRARSQSLDDFKRRPRLDM
ncbi:MAG: hypothetical protein H7Y20_16985, partial [Bryobacteraceae bacterium]|nr:hypothetical protein [Bryobacteraceae bacterium]